MTSAVARPVRRQRGDEAAHFFGHERLFEHGAAHFGQEASGGLAERVTGEERGDFAARQGSTPSGSADRPPRPSSVDAGTRDPPRAEQAGASVIEGTEVVGITQDGDGVTATIAKTSLLGENYVIIGLPDGAKMDTEPYYKEVLQQYPIPGVE